MSPFAIVRVAALVVCMAASGEQVAADPVRLDQQSIPNFSRSLTLFNNDLNAQTFTVGVNGVLAAVDVYLWMQIGAETDVNPITLQVFNVSDGFPTTSLGMTTIAPSSVPLDPGAFVNVDVSHFGVRVSSGDQLAIALQSVFPRPNEAGYAWAGTESAGGAVYPRGGVSIRKNGEPNWTPLPFGIEMDFGFRTYVASEPAAVPEPGTLTLLGVGFAATAWRARRRRSIRSTTAIPAQ